MRVAGRHRRVGALRARGTVPAILMRLALRLPLLRALAVGLVLLLEAVAQLRAGGGDGALVRLPSAVGVAPAEVARERDPPRLARCPVALRQQDRVGARAIATASVDLVGGHHEAVEGGVHAADLGAVGQRDLR